MMARRLHLFVWILYLALSVGGRYFDHNLPPLPGEFYSGYVEEIITKEEPGLNDTTTTISLSWTAYNSELQLLREDRFAAEYPMAQPRAVSRIEDGKIGVVYTINRQSRDCFIKSLYENDTAKSTEGNVHMQTHWKDIISSTLNYSYKGPSVVRSAVVDVWSLCHNLTNNESEVMIALTRPGTPVRSLNSMVEDPVLWQLSMSGNHSINGDFSTVFNFFDFSYDRPNSDVFDPSKCFSSEDYELLILQLPGRVSEVDVTHLHSSIRMTVANYTGVYPFQVGNIQIIWENETFMFVSLQISNLSHFARISRRVSAFDALRLIMSGLSSTWRLPFPIELSPGVQEFPILYTNTNNDLLGSCFEMSTYPTLWVSSTQEVESSSTYSQTSVMPTFSINPTTVLTSLNSFGPVPSTVAVSSVLSFSTSCAIPPPLNTPLTVVHTVTETVACSPKPMATVTSNMLPHFSTEFPPSRTNSPCAAGLGTGGAVGVAIGAFVGGILAALLTIVFCVLCCNWCNHQTMKREGWQPVSRTKHVSKEMDYFQ